MKTTMRGALLAASLALLCFSSANSQAIDQNGFGAADAINPIDETTSEFRRRDRDPCRKPFRELDGTCTNSIESVLGSTGLAQFSYIPSRSSARPTGSRLPSARLISNIVSAQPGDKLSSRRINEFTTFLGQFLDHNLISTPVNVEEEFNIPIPRDDAIFGNFSNGELPFERSVRAGVTGRVNIERPINSLTSAVDLVGVYGPDPARLVAIRTMTDGLLKTSAGDLLPLNTARMVNAPSNSARFFLAGDHRANENPALTSMHVLFVREHNTIARQLKKAFPDKNDETLFQFARVVNIAQFQKVIFEEFYPALTGRHLRYTGFKPFVDPTVSDLFGGAAFRIGHTMITDKISQRAAGNRKLPDTPLSSMFFRDSSVLRNTGVDTFLRGMLFERSQEVDVFVVDALRNFLFKNIPQERGFDLIALNLQRGRDHALPTYNDIRQLFRVRRARDFKHITRNTAVQGALHTAYGDVNNVEAWVGLMAEDHVPGASMGRTMLRIWDREFRRLMEGDRFFFRRTSAYPRELVEGFPRLTEMLNERDTMKGILLRNTGITESEVSRPLFNSAV